MQHFVGDCFFFARLVAFPLNRYLIASFFEVSVQTVVRDIQFSAFKKFHIDRTLFNVKVIVHHLVPFFEPSHLLLGNFCPEFVRFLN